MKVYAIKATSAVATYDVGEISARGPARAFEKARERLLTMQRERQLEDVGPFDFSVYRESELTHRWIYTQELEKWGLNKKASFSIRDHDGRGNIFDAVVRFEWRICISEKASPTARDSLHVVSIYPGEDQARGLCGAKFGGNAVDPSGKLLCVSCMQNLCNFIALGRRLLDPGEPSRIIWPAGIEPPPFVQKRRFKAKRDHIGQRLRFKIFVRDRCTCRYCGRQPPDAVLVIDHFLAVANGGTNDPSNLFTSCEDCNSGKGAMRI
jgi:hypothetical protein